MTPKEMILQAMHDLGITVESTFVPWSKSRHFKPNAGVRERSLNWTVTIKRNGHEVITTDYTAGIGNAPSYPGWLDRMTEDVAEALIVESETGKAARIGTTMVHATGRSIVLDACDVVYSLVLDADAIEFATFEEWASNFGCDVDSHKAESTYRACLETGLKLRAGVGDAGLAKLKLACEGY